ncbi:MAG TPA: pirin family protein [Dongiaceae bacterium]|nr:pirin family protein [Dongiaceae bacterium]
MIAVRPAADRGRTSLAWLDSRHTFSFGGYHDPAQMGFRTLRVINDDRVRPSQGYSTHAHRDMEILTLVLDGALEHRDSLGTGSIIRAGDAQRMTAGTGVTHSEFNPSPDAPVRFLQIWILPERAGLIPEYEQRSFPEAARRNRLTPIAARDGRDDSLYLHQEAIVSLGLLDPGRSITCASEKGGNLYLHVYGGNLELDGKRLADGDGAAATGTAELVVRSLEGSDPARFLLFDLA